MRKILKTIIFTIALSEGAHAADYSPRPANTWGIEDVRTAYEIGYSWIRADEKVYVDGDRISHLIWKSQMPVFIGGIDFRSTSGLTVDVRSRIGLFATTRMDDYDWLSNKPQFKSFRFEEWTDYSHHEAVDVERYFDADLALGQDFNVGHAQRINLHGGLKYATIKFNCYGGRYIYSRNDFRDFTGSFPDMLGVTYEQRIPAAFIGASWAGEFAQTLITIQARLGATVGAQDADRHWRRQVIYSTDYNNARFVQIRGEVHHQLSPQATMFAAAQFERFDEMAGNFWVTDLQENFTTQSHGTGGAALKNLTVSFGLKVGF